MFYLNVEMRSSINKYDVMMKNECGSYNNHSVHIL
jgi:hypothetical protein